MVPRPFCRALSAAPFLPRPFCRALSAAPFLPRLIASFSLALVCALPCLADPAAPPAWPSSWDSGKQGAFVTALCDDHAGHIYAATEGSGVARWDGHEWTQFTTENTGGGLGDDDCYSLTCDRLGRLWCGTDRTGVSVYNGRTWKTYDRLTGPPGCHVVALTISPLTGDVWGCTEAGLFSYSLRTNTWRSYTRADGLPADACSCLAFAPNGTLYAGTQADGIAIASPIDNYRAWRVVPGPAMPPPSPGGDGLPSALINALLVAHDGTVYTATDDGLARSPDGGHTWRFLRGADWKDMVKGEWRGPAPVATDTGGRLLAEDYVTALAEDGAGHLFISHRRKGVGVYDERTATGATPPGAYGGYADALLSEGDGRVLVGSYGDGLGMVRLPDAPTPAFPAPSPLAETVPPLPAPAAPPTLSQMNAMLRVVSAVPPDPQEFRPHAVALDDDWATRGDWLGRYGRYWACLCAICSPSDYTWGAGWEPVRYASQMGPDHDPGDSLRYWVQWLYTADPRVLEMPPTYLDSRIKRGLTTAALDRREAEQDDHSEAYPMTREALGVYETVTVPPGLYFLSVYEMNKDGHSDDNRDRDYRLSVRPHTAASLADITSFSREPEWAHGRVSQFWGGVWERFLVRGPVTLDVAVGKNHSFNTIVQAVTLDLVDETPPPYFVTVDQWEQEQAQKRGLWQSQLAERHAAPFAPARSTNEAAGRLLAALSRAQAVNSVWWGVNGRRLYLSLARWYAALAARPRTKLDPEQWRRLGTCDYQSGLYPQWEDGLRRAGLTPACDIEKALKWDGISEGGEGYFVVTAGQGKSTGGTSSQTDNQ